MGEIQESFLGNRENAHLAGVKTHLEFLKVVPLLCVTLFQIMVEVSCTKPKGMKLSIWPQQQGCRGLLISYSRVSTLPLPHHVDAVRVSCEGEGIATVRSPKVNGRHHKMGVPRNRAGQLWNVSVMHWCPILRHVGSQSRLLCIKLYGRFFKVGRAAAKLYDHTSQWHANSRSGLSIRTVQIKYAAFRIPRSGSLLIVRLSTSD